MLHEIGHAWVCRKEKIRVSHISLFILGGAIQLDHEPYHPKVEARLVAAGPAVNLFLSLIFFAVTAISQSIIKEVSEYMVQVNLLLAGFNLLPLLPMDGGRLLHALYWNLSGSFTRATAWTNSTSLGIAVLAGLSSIAIKGTLPIVGILVAGLAGFLGYSSIINFSERKKVPERSQNR